MGQVVVGSSFADPRISPTLEPIRNFFKRNASCAALIDGGALATAILLDLLCSVESRRNRRRTRLLDTNLLGGMNLPRQDLFSVGTV
jgi:hypothetical protein